MRWEGLSKDVSRVCPGYALSLSYSRSQTRVTILDADKAPLRISPLPTPLQAIVDVVAAAATSQGPWVAMYLAAGSAVVEGLDVDAAQSGLAAFEFAVKAGHADIAVRLIREGATTVNTVDHRGLAPLSLAAAYGDVALVRELVETFGADPEHRDTNGATPLAWAVLRGSLGVVTYFVSELGVDIDVEVADDAGTLTLAQMGLNSRRREAVEILRETMERRAAHQEAEQSMPPYGDAQFALDEASLSVADGLASLSEVCPPELAALAPEPRAMSDVYYLQRLVQELQRRLAEKNARVGDLEEQLSRSTSECVMLAAQNRLLRERCLDGAAGPRATPKRPSSAATAARPSSASVRTRPSSATACPRPSSAAATGRPSAEAATRPSSALARARPTSAMTTCASSPPSRPSTARASGREDLGRYSALSRLVEVSREGCDANAVPHPSNLVLDSESAFYFPILEEANKWAEEHRRVNLVGQRVLIPVLCLRCASGSSVTFESLVGEGPLLNKLLEDLRGCMEAPFNVYEPLTVTQSCNKLHSSSNLRLAVLLMYQALHRETLVKAWCVVRSHSPKGHGRAAEPGEAAISAMEASAMARWSPEAPPRPPALAARAPRRMLRPHSAVARVAVC